MAVIQTRVDVISLAVVVVKKDANGVGSKEVNGVGRKMRLADVHHLDLTTGLKSAVRGWRLSEIIFCIIHVPLYRVFRLVQDLLLTSRVT